VPRHHHDRGSALSEPSVDAVFDALGDATRRRILDMIGERGQATATELADELDISRQAVAKHLSRLHVAGLARVQRSGREARYAVSTDALDSVAAWLSSAARAWDGRLDRLRRELERREPQA
jgi:DNA-binding transcriptional ArsR family regulator